MAAPVVRRRRDGLVEITREGRRRRLGRGVATAAIALPIGLAVLASVAATLPVILLALPAALACAAALVAVASLRRLPDRRARRHAAPVVVRPLRAR